MTDHTDKPRARNLKTLRPRKHELEFFIADEVELSSFRDEMASMEHPFFALKGGDTKVREYKNGNVNITVSPNVKYGIATIFDKDVWIYAISKLQHALNNNEPISQKICFTPYDFFLTTNRDIGGRTYKELEKALERLRGTSITTNIYYFEDKWESKGFGLIDSWRITSEKKGNLDIGMVEITLPNWLYQAITNTKVLQISSDYFRIRKAIDRRLYEIARKHCGNKYEFNISLEKLYLKVGSTSTKEKFKYNIKTLTKTNDLPDYKIRYDAERDLVIFNNRNLTPEQEEKEQHREKGKREIYNLKKSLAEKRGGK